MKLRIWMLVALASLAFLSQRAGLADAPPPPFVCTPVPVFPAAVIFAEYPHFYYYCKNKSTVADAQSAMPADIPIYLRNGSSLRIVVMDINPVRQQVNVAIGSAKPYTELDSSVVQGVFQAALPANAVSPANAKAGSKSKQLTDALENIKDKTQKTFSLGIVSESPLARDFQGLTDDQMAQKADALLKTMSSCEQAHSALDAQINTLQQHVDDLIAQINKYNDESKWLQANYTGKVNDMIKSDKIPSLENFKDSVGGIATIPATATTFASQSSPLNGKDFATVIGDIKTTAINLHGSLHKGMNADCQSIYKDELADDQDYLEKLFNTTSTNTSLADTLTNELAADNELLNQISDAKSALLKLVSNPENYTYITTIPPEDRIQDQVPVTISIQDRILPTLSALPATPPSNVSKKAQTAQTKAASTPGTTTAFTVSFGAGPITFESAGIVFTPLPQHSFATATTTTTSGQACSASTTTGNYCIVDNAASGWRILPMAVVSARYWTLDSSNSRTQFLLPNYLSAGATIKSNSSAGSSTSLEYLLGFSWAIPVVSPYHSPNLFATVGAYAGEVTQLGGGLKLGVQNGTAPTTLPTSSAYKWKLGFAVTYAFGSQGGNTKPAKTSTNGKAQPASDPAPAANQ